MAKNDVEKQKNGLENEKMSKSDITNYMTVFYMLFRSEKRRIYQQENIKEC